MKGQASKLPERGRRRSSEGRRSTEKQRSEEQRRQHPLTMGALTAVRRQRGRRPLACRQRAAHWQQLNMDNQNSGGGISLPCFQRRVFRITSTPKYLCYNAGPSGIGFWISDAEKMLVRRSAWPGLHYPGGERDARHIYMCVCIEKTTSSSTCGTTS